MAEIVVLQENESGLDSDRECIEHNLKAKAEIEPKPN